ncbi:hypothetical protein [Alteromonas macleodii]|uniref:Membrane protein n=1 Tax=Alteromonas macleodii TaxID=28108 RepID=A0AB36FYP0_ALTMA|nr:hypothetical protein [Alteromonas macleodii]OES30955.1 putative membrane protein [Alteromonas macleodii]OES31476.1 putative membrane protein [Alteromonas macleodii]OES31805.1 putative membrane protein [Alteromonas macleodii]OES41105.1 putative membrane protein [Alteromonas macleodii]
MDLSDNLVKGIFDNMRNLVLSSVIISTGILIAKNNLNDTSELYLYVIAGYTILAGLGLFALNVVHAWKKFQETSLARYAVIALSITYALVALEVFRALWLGRVAVGT